MRGDLLNLILGALRRGEQRRGKGQTGFLFVQFFDEGEPPLVSNEGDTGEYLITMDAWMAAMDCYVAQANADEATLSDWEPEDCKAN
jgi:hypothetical protein